MFKSQKLVNLLFLIGATPFVNDVRGVLIQARALNAAKEAFLSPAKGLKARYASTADVNQV